MSLSRSMGSNHWPRANSLQNSDRTKWIWIAKSQSYGRNGTRIADPSAEHSCRDNGQTTFRELTGRTWGPCLTDPEKG